MLLVMLCCLVEAKRAIESEGEEAEALEWLSCLVFDLHISCLLIWFNLIRVGEAKIKSSNHPQDNGQMRRLNIK